MVPVTSHLGTCSLPAKAASQLHYWTSLLESSLTGYLILCDSPHRTHLPPPRAGQNKPTLFVSSELCRDLRQRNPLPYSHPYRFQPLDSSYHIKLCLSSNALSSLALPPPYFRMYFTNALPLPTLIWQLYFPRIKIVTSFIHPTLCQALC